MNHSCLLLFSSLLTNCSCVIAEYKSWWRWAQPHWCFAINSLWHWLESSKWPSGLSCHYNCSLHNMSVDWYNTQQMCRPNIVILSHDELRWPTLICQDMVTCFSAEVIIPYSVPTSSFTGRLMDCALILLIISVFQASSSVSWSSWCSDNFLLHSLLHLLMSWY